MNRSALCTLIDECHWDKHRFRMRCRLYCACSWNMFDFNIQFMQRAWLQHVSVWLNDTPHMQCVELRCIELEVCRQQQLQQQLPSSTRELLRKCLGTQHSLSNSHIEVKSRLAADIAAEEVGAAATHWLNKTVHQL